MRDRVEECVLEFVAAAQHLGVGRVAAHAFLLDRHAELTGPPWPTGGPQDGQTARG